MQGAPHSTPRSKTKQAIVTMVAGRSLNWQGTRLLTGGMRVHFASLRGRHCTPSSKLDSVQFRSTPLRPTARQQARGVAAAHPALTR